MLTRLPARHFATFFILLGLAALMCLLLSGCGTLNSVDNTFRSRVSEVDPSVSVTDNNQTGNLGVQAETKIFLRDPLTGK